MHRFLCFQVVNVTWELLKKNEVKCKLSDFLAFRECSDCNLNNCDVHNNGIKMNTKKKKNEE